MSSTTNKSPRDAAPLAVLGAGAWGAAIAGLAARGGRDVRLWMRDPDRAVAWARDRTDPNGRAHAPVPPSVRPTADLGEAVEAVVGAFVVVPVAATDEVAAALAGALSAHGPGPCDAGAPIVVSCAKGLVGPGLTRPSERLAHALPGLPVVILSGPNLAAEIARGLPAAATVAGTDRRAVARARPWLAGPRFRVYEGNDPIGAEIAGAYKNVVALAAGMADALELGDNAKAALIARGLAELVRIGRACGAQERTLYGLAGVGDLVATCASATSRNHRAGAMLARGASRDAVVGSGVTAEGLGTVVAVVDFAREAGLRLPIARAVRSVVEGTRSAEAALRTLLEGAPRPEWEDGTDRMRP